MSSEPSSKEKRVTPGWNDPPFIPMNTTTTKPRLSLNRRVAMPINSSSTQPSNQASSFNLTASTNIPPVPVTLQSSTPMPPNCPQAKS